MLRRATRASRSFWGNVEPSWAVLTLGMLLLGAGTCVAVYLMLDWLDRLAAFKSNEGKPIEIKDYLLAKLDVVKIGLSVVAGGGALFALYLAVRRQRTNERDLQSRLDAQVHTELDALNRRVTEQYTKSIDQLGSDNAMIRLGGIYALERLAQENSDQRQTIVNVLCAYLRRSYPTLALKGVNKSLVDPRELFGVEEMQVRLAVQEILHQNLSDSYFSGDDGVWGNNLNQWRQVDLNLSGAALFEWNFVGCTVRTGDFKGAKFFGCARFFSSTLVRSDFSNAVFHDEANFIGVGFTRYTTFDGARFKAPAEFGACKFEWAVFDRAVFDCEATFGGRSGRNGGLSAGARLGGHMASFFRVTFNGDTSFEEVVFSAGVANFDEAMFNHNARFRESSFECHSSFGGAIFSGRVDFTDVKFLKPTVRGKVRLIGLRGEMGDVLPQGDRFEVVIDEGDDSIDS